MSRILLSNTLLMDDEYSHGFFDDDISLFELKPAKTKKLTIEQTHDIADFEIFEDELIVYKGKSKTVKVPEGITTIGASAFWNNTFRTDHSSTKPKEVRRRLLLLLLKST